MKILKARLLERRIAEREAELATLKGEHVEAGWGNQIRSYVLHPYQMVKDHRTEHETSDTSGVLDGDLDAFMLAELERVATTGRARRRCLTRCRELRPAARPATSRACIDVFYDVARRARSAERSAAQPRNAGALERALRHLVDHRSGARRSSPTTGDASSPSACVHVRGRCRLPRLPVRRARPGRAAASGGALLECLSRRRAGDPPGAPAPRPTSPSRRASTPRSGWRPATPLYLLRGGCRRPRPAGAAARASRATVRIDATSDVVAARLTRPARLRSVRQDHAFWAGTGRRGWAVPRRDRRPSPGTATSSRADGSDRSPCVGPELVARLIGHLTRSVDRRRWRGRSSCPGASRRALARCSGRPAHRRHAGRLLRRPRRVRASTATCR